MSLQSSAQSTLQNISHLPAIAVVYRQSSHTPDSSSHTHTCPAPDTPRRRSKPAIRTTRFLLAAASPQHLPHRASLQVSASAPLAHCTPLQNDRPAQLTAA